MVLHRHCQPAHVLHQSTQFNPQKHKNKQREKTYTAAVGGLYMQCDKTPQILQEWWRETEKITEIKAVAATKQNTGSYSVLILHTIPFWPFLGVSVKKSKLYVV